VQEILAGLWSEVLGLDRADPDESFFQQGGHSLLAMKLAARLRDAFGVDLPLTTLFAAPTLGKLADEVETALSAGAGSDPPIQRARRGGELPVSFPQQRLWFLDQLEPGSAFYNVPAAVRLTGPLHLPALARTFSALVERHEVLRTIFPEQDGRPVQVILPPAPTPLPVVDLGALPEGVRVVVAQDLADREAALPFDLTADSMLRVRVLRLSAEDHAVCMTSHHIAGDAWSLGILLHELSLFYEAFRTGGLPPLPPLPLQYADYACWQQDWLAGPALGEELTYWRRQLGGRLPALELPTDRPRPSRPSRAGRTTVYRFPQELAAAAADFSRRHDVTLYMTLLAAYAVVLQRWTGLEELLVGMPIENRSRPETQGLVGFFVNTLPLRLDLRGAPTFLDLLRQVRGLVLGALAHQDLPLDKLVEEVRPERALDESPLFQVTFGLRTGGGERLRIPGLETGPLSPVQESARFDLTLWMAVEEGGLAASWCYRTDLFEPSTIERLNGRYRQLLATAVAKPATEIDALGWETAHEQAQAEEAARRRRAAVRERFHRVQPTKITLNRA
jgi:acyl carrier protein